MSVAVLGGGAFGTALAISLAQSQPVTLWARAPADMETQRENARHLPGCTFPDGLSVTGDLIVAAQSKTLLIAIPMQTLRPFLDANAGHLATRAIVACCKGIDLATGLGPVKTIRQVVPSATAAILTGPSFAADIARGLPTALTLACQSEKAGRRLQTALTTANLRLYRTTDTTGAELGGAIKNVVAIACGAAMGAGLGESARAALMTRGFAEMLRLARHLGADPGTLSGLSGFGDLALTCTSAQSRNYRLGMALSAGETLSPDTTVEGAATARAVHKIATEAALDMPITAAVAGVLDNALDVESAMLALLARPLKEE